MEPRQIQSLRAEHLDQARAHWTFQGEPQLISTVENFVYSVRVDGIERILRLAHEEHRTRDDIQAELDWVAHLRTRQVPVCGPIPTVSGESVATLVSEGTTMHACLFEFASGKRPRKEDLGAPLFRAWGAAVGAMHAATLDYRPPAGSPRRFSWNPDELYGPNLDQLKGRDPSLVEDLGAQATRINALPRPSDRFALVHTDVHQGNFFVDRGSLHIFDTDDCCHHWLIQDITMPLYYAQLFCQQDHVARAREFLIPFFRGYNSRHPLNLETIDHIPLFLRLRDLELVMVIQVWEDDVENRWMQVTRRNQVEGHPLRDLDFTGIAEESLVDRD